MATVSPFQRRVLAAIQAQGGTAVYRRGGYWDGADGAVLRVEPEPGSVQENPGTQTIMSLERKGLLRRTMRLTIAWADPRELTPAALDLLREN